MTDTHNFRFAFFQRSELTELDSNFIKSNYADSDVTGSNTAGPDNQPQSDDLAKPGDITEPLPCVVLYLVNEKTKIARVIAQDQTGVALMEVPSRSPSPSIADSKSDFILVRFNSEVRLKDSFTMIGAENITFAAPKGTYSSPFLLEALLLRSDINFRRKVSMCNYCRYSFLFL